MQQVLWTQAIAWTGPEHGLVVTSDRVAFSAGGKLFIRDRAGLPVAEVQFGSPVSAPTADTDGNFYLAGSAAYSFDRDGTPRWSVPFGPPLILDSTLAGSFLLSPNGVLYTTATDGMMYALRTDGSVVWQRSVGVRGNGPVGVSAGVGDVLAGSTATGAPQFFDVATGDPLGALVSNGFAYSTYFFGYSHRVIAVARNPALFNTYSVDEFDECGAKVWSRPTTMAMQEPGLLGRDDALLVADWQGVGSQIWLQLHDLTGASIAGPTPAAWPLLLGADGITYAITCDDVAGTSTLAALAPDLATIWTLDLGGGCPNGGSALAEDGVLYLLRGNVSGIELVAVQTASPGLANSSWPKMRHDNRNTHWLSP